MKDRSTNFLNTDLPSRMCAFLLKSQNTGSQCVHSTFPQTKFDQYWYLIDWGFQTLPPIVWLLTPLFPDHCGQRNSFAYHHNSVRGQFVAVCCRPLFFKDVTSSTLLLLERILIFKFSLVVMGCMIYVYDSSFTTGFQIIFLSLDYFFWRSGSVLNKSLLNNIAMEVVATRVSKAI